MTDDLVKRLREDCDVFGDWICGEAAYRIEELEADLRKMALDCLAAQGQAADAYEAQLAAEAKLATCEKYKAAYAECDRIGTQAVRDLEAKLASVIAAYRIEAMRREDYSHESFDQHIAELKGKTDD